MFTSVGRKLEKANFHLKTDRFRKLLKPEPPRFIMLTPRSSSMIAKLLTKFYDFSATPPLDYKLA